MTSDEDDDCDSEDAPELFREAFIFRSKHGTSIANLDSRLVADLNNIARSTVAVWDAIYTNGGVGKETPELFDYVRFNPGIVFSSVDCHDDLVQGLREGGEGEYHSRVAYVPKPNEEGLDTLVERLKTVHIKGVIVDL